MNYSEFNNELIDLRRHFHENPELGFNEVNTQQYIIDYLTDLGLHPQKIAKTGVVCLIEGKNKSPVLLLRSDMDALPIQEENGVSYKSCVDGVMHACGHDGHMAMLLIAAKILLERRNELNCTIKLAFQPNEEEAGAYLMIEEGIMNNPKVDYGLGFHLWSPLATGKIGIKSGALMASSYYYKVEVRGIGGHGGSPHQANNPVDAINMMINEIYRFQSQDLDVTRPTLISICKLNAGIDSPIIIHDTAYFEGSIRCLHEDGEVVRTKMSELIKGIAKYKECEAYVEFFYGNEVIMNDSAMTSRVLEVVGKIYPKEKILSEGISVMVGDDFSDFAMLVPSCYYFIGIGDEEKGTNFPHHHPKFNIDEDVLIKGVEIIVETALSF